MVPYPRTHLLTYHGVLAPAASLRDQIIPDPSEEGARSNYGDATTDQSRASALRHRQRGGTRRRRTIWALLLLRVFAIDVLACSCGGRAVPLKFITKPSVIHKILDHLGLPTKPPFIAPARAPPQSALPFA